TARCHAHYEQICQERKRRKKKTEERGRKSKKTFRLNSSKKIDEENPLLSNRQVQATFRTPLTLSAVGTFRQREPFDIPNPHQYAIAWIGAKISSPIKRKTSMSSYRDVKAQIAKLEKQAADLFKKEVADVVAKIKGLMQEYGLSTSDLDLKGKSAKTQRAKKANFKPAGVPKYRDPATGKTWTGHGKAPAFIADAVKKGKSKEDFLIEKTAAAPKSAVKKVTKPSKIATVAKATRVTKSAKAKTAKPVAKPATKKSSVAKKPVKVAAPKSAAKKPAVKAAKQPSLVKAVTPTPAPNKPA
ncbi:MAG: H-NS histone family protein, partial [bacterium]